RGKKEKRGGKVKKGKKSTVRRGETENVNGDGIYLTKTTHLLLENSRIGAAPGEGADGCQFAYQNSDDNISAEIVIRGNL
ncbi:right-handed parallel beta-helix repeat-containing protein, partial [Rhizobium ruizarguesonis]